ATDSVNVSSVLGAGTNEGADTGLTKTGLGLLTLTASNTYIGGTRINGGTLQLGDGTSGDDGSITDNITNKAALVYNPFGSQSYSGAISGNGTLTKIGAGSLLLSASNNYTGGTWINSGT